MGWNIFIWFGIAAVLLSAAGAVVSMCANDHRSQSSLRYRRRRGLAITFASSSLLVLAVFIALLWLELGRPPLRTMGETRLWYSFFALFSGLFTYLRWRYRWILSFSTVLATVFIMINIFRPEIHDQTLMPALQSPWFIPHVTVYMFSYSFLGCAFLLALVGLFTTKNNVMSAADTLVYIGMAFLTFGNRFPVHQGSSGTFLDFPQHMAVKGVIINPVLGAVVLSKGIVGLAGVNPLGMFSVCVAYRQRLPTLAAF